MFDYKGTAALGDVEYEDGFDKWDDIKSALNGMDSVPIKVNHNSKDVIGVCKHWDFDEREKKLNIGLNRDDLEIGIDAVNNVSPQYEVDENGKITKVNHFAIGNTFKPFCEVCKVIKNRGEEMEEEQEEVEEPSEMEKLQAQVEELRKKNLEYEKQLIEKDNEAYKRILADLEDNSLDLSPNEEVEQDLETKPKGGQEFDPFDIGANTRYINQLRGK